MESPGVSRIAAEEAWESEVLPASEAAPAPAESEVAPASPEGEAVPEPAEERPSMLSRLASSQTFWREEFRLDRMPRLLQLLWRNP